SWSAPCARPHWSQPDHYGFGFGILFQDFVAHFAAPAGLFVTAKRKGSVKDIVAVNPSRAGLELGRDTVSFGNVTGPDASRQSVFRLVRPRNQFFRLRERFRHHDWAEDFFPHNAHARLHIL